MLDFLEVDFFELDFFLVLLDLVLDFFLEPDCFFLCALEILAARSLDMPLSFRAS